VSLEPARSAAARAALERDGADSTEPAALR
jgi:hypothetical protein